MLLALATATALAAPGDVDRVTFSFVGGSPDPDDASVNPVTSLDGSIVVFQSDATNLDEFHSDTNNRLDVFQREAGSTVRDSFANGGFTQSDADSADPDVTDNGSDVAFDSFSNVLVAGDSGFRDVFLRTPESADTTRVSVADGGGNPNGDSSNPDLFSDSSRVVFQSSATNLLPALTT